MKQNTLLKSFLFLALIVSLTSPAFASEVIGTLSSSGNKGTEQTTSQQNTGGQSSSQESTPRETPDNGQVAGNVSDDSTSTASGGSGNNGGPDSGKVLGESTMAANTTAAPSSDGSSLAPSSKAQAVDYGTGVSENNVMPQGFDPILGQGAIEGAANQVATAEGALEQISPLSWFWIIVLTLLLIAVITYIYNHNKTRIGRTQLHY